MSKLPPSTRARRRALAIFAAASIAETEQFVESLSSKGQAHNGTGVVTVTPRIAKQLWAAGRSDSAFAWNGKKLAFTQGGDLVPRASVKAAANAVVNAARLKIAAAARSLQQGTLGVADWVAEHDKWIKLTIGANSALARGGFDAMTPSAWSSASAKVAKQFGYSRAFAEDVARGRYGTVGSELSNGVLSRAAMYADSGRSTYENTLMEVHQENGVELARRVLGAADNCPDCLAWAGDEWRPIDDVEEIGSSVCGSNCHCEIIYFKTGDG